ncbi:MAG: SRPBCC family protein [Actinomycetota bacterium]|nr:SRPBCC family protein [Actinomycetota bacterium]
MAEKSRQSIMVAAPAADVLAVIADFDAYPQWAASVKKAEVVEEYEDGYASQVRFSVDAGPIKDEYTLAYQWAQDGSWVSWSLVESGVMKSQEGSYDLAEVTGGTEVTYTLEVETSMPMLGLLRRKGEKMIMDIALKELKKRVEG